MIATETAPKKPAAKPHADKRRKIDARTVDEMARLMSIQVTETGAALQLGLKPRQWFNWKNCKRNNPKFNEILTRIRETKLATVIQSIDDAGSKGLRPDWRAHAWMAEKVLAPERLGQQPAGLQVTVSVDESKLRRIADIYARTLADAATPAALPAPGPGNAIDCPAIITDHSPGETPAGTTPDDWTDGTD